MGGRDTVAALERQFRAIEDGPHLVVGSWSSLVFHRCETRVEAERKAAGYVHAPRVVIDEAAWPAPSRGGGKR
jgi:hypothetical protein